MDKKENGMEKDSALGGQENLGFDGLDNISGEAGDGWEINIDELLEQADMLVNNDMMPPMPELEGENSKRLSENRPAARTEQEIPPKPENVEQPKKAAESPAQANTASGLEMDSDLDEINSLLEQANLNEKIDDDMLALLESATQNQEDEDNPDEVFDIFAEGDMPLEELNSSETPQQTETEEEEEEGDSKKKFSRKKKKKKEKKEKKEKKPKKASKKEGETGDEDEEGGKKPGFLSKITALFGGGDEDFEDEKPDTAADENVKLLNELNGDEGKKSGKKAKKGAKKKEDKKEKKNAKEAKPKEKAKKPAAEKKKKEKPVEKPAAEKPVKILNGRSFAAIAGLCLSIIAGVMIVTNFIPEYADKQTARRAFQDKDYETVYQLFYDKKLSAEETLIFNQSKVIRQMERRLEAYQNNMALGKELEAVDALMRGVEKYQTLWEADEYQVRSEVDALYLEICAVLEINYGITREEAEAIATSDEVAYTKALYAILGQDISSPSEADAEGDEGLTGQDTGAGTGANTPQEQPSEGETSGEESPEEPLEDMLPEEEDLLN